MSFRALSKLKHGIKQNLRVFSFFVKSKVMVGVGWCLPDSKTIMLYVFCQFTFSTGYQL